MSDPLHGIAVVDAHQHFWNPEVNDQPWLCDDAADPVPLRRLQQSAPALPAGRLPARRRALPGGRHRLRRGRVGAARPVGENCPGSPACGTTAASPAWPWPRPGSTGRHRGAARTRWQAFDFVRGIRHKPRANASPQDGAPGGMTDRGLAPRLRRAGPPRPALRPADAVVAPARSAASGGRLPADADHHQPHRRCRPIAAPQGLAAWRAALARPRSAPTSR